MKRFLSERNLVVFLFVIASACFVFAEQDARKVEKLLTTPADDVSSIIPQPNNTAENDFSGETQSLNREHSHYR